MAALQNFLNQVQRRHSYSNMSSLRFLRHTPVRHAEATVTALVVFARGARRMANQGDPRTRIIQRMLYPRNGPRSESPIGVYRMDAKLALRRAVPNPEVHETIERAWLLHQRHKRNARSAELQRKWDSMHRAMEELRLFDYRRYLEINNVEDPRVRSDEDTALLKTIRGQERNVIEGRIRGLFPRELRAPTNTPSHRSWNYEWRYAPDCGHITSSLKINRNPLKLLSEKRALEQRGD